MRNVLMGVAAVALAATGAYADPGNGKGGEKGGGQAKAAGQKGGGDRGQGGGSMKMAQNGNGQGNGNASRGGEMKAKGNDRGPAMKADKGPDMVRGNDKEKGWSGKSNGKDVARVVDVRDGKRNGGDYGRDYDRDRDGFRFDYRDGRALEYGLIDGCPPGLAKKNNGCNPPGLVKRGDYDYDRSSWWRLPGLSDGRYRYYDNNLVRISPTGSILGYYPLMGGALAAGNLWPDWFGYEPVPSYYESYYGLGPTGSYRYADNVLYRVDPETAAITSIAALLTGDSFSVGQRIPSGYGVYNVPYAYRDRYADGPDAYYRYSDGYVYQVDPTTQLIQAAIQLLI